MPPTILICHVNDAKRTLTILPVATREDAYEELRAKMGRRVGNIAYR